MIGVVWSKVRNYLYDKNYLAVSRSSSFVVSIGNITWGGTGKTALAGRIASFLISQGLGVAIVSRGYGRKSRGLLVVSDGRHVLQTWEEAGDEPYLLARKAPQAMVVVSENRKEALRLLEAHRPDVVLLDDGFQHRRVARDLDLVLIDASEDLPKQKVMPLGKLREPLDSLKRADTLVLTHSKNAQPSTLEWIARNAQAPVFHANYAPEPNPEWVGKRLAAFCATGAPHHFFEMLQRNRATLVFTRIFRDHHIYSRKDLAELLGEALTAGADALATTEKDAVKIDASALRLPLVVVKAELKLEEETEFNEFILGNLMEHCGRL